MIDTVRVQRITGTSEGAGGVISPTLSTIYEGKARFMVRTRERLGGSWVNLGQQQVIMSRLELHIPVDAPDVLEGDRATVLTSQLDPLLPGKIFVVRDTMLKSFVTARRITVIEVTS